MANVSITDSSVLPKSITITEDGKTVTISETKQPVTISTNQLTTNITGALSSLTDVNITGIADDQILVYDSTSGKWKNEANSGSAPVDSVNGQTGVVVLDTDDISEGANKYYADSLVDAHLTGGTGVTYNAGDISIGQSVATTDNVTFGEVTADELIGNLRGPVIMKAKAGEDLTKGEAVYISGISGNTPVVSLADANNGTKMPAVGLSNATVSNNASVDILTFGQITNINTTVNVGGTWQEGDSLYVDTTPGVLTRTAPTGELSEIQAFCKVEKVHASTGIILIQGAGRTNATPNLDDGNIFIGGSNNGTPNTVNLNTKVSDLGYITASSTDTLTNKSGNVSQFTNDAGYLTSETDSQTLSFSNPDLSISNGNSVDLSALTPSSLPFSSITSTPTTLSGYGITDGVTGASTTTFTNKSGNISQWTNDAGYLTSETDSQTLSFSSPDLSISNGNSVDISALTTGFITASSTDTLTNKSGNVSQFTNDANYMVENVSSASDLSDVNYSTTPTNGQVLVWDVVNQYWEPGTASGSGIAAVVDDTSPQLGGNLDVQANLISSSNNIVRINDALQIMDGNSIRFQNGAQTQEITLASPTTLSVGYDLRFPGSAPANDQYITVNNTGALSFADIPAAGISEVVDDTTPQLGGNLDTNNNTITNALGDVKINKTLMEQSHSDYSLTIDNQDNSGLGLRIKAGNSDSGTYGSLAVLSVSDKDNDNKFIVKASGEVVAYHNLTVHDVYINSPSAGESQISTLTSGENLNITTNSANLSLNDIVWPASDGTTGQILQTDGSGNLSFVTNSGGSGIAAVVDDTTPQLGGNLDQNGKTINDDSRNYQMLGNVDAPTSALFDAFGNTTRAQGVVNVNSVTQPSDRLYSNPRLSAVTFTGDVSGGSNGGRIRHNFTEGNAIMDGNDNTTSGFGRGIHGQWMSMNISNNHASDASTVTSANALSIVPQATGSQSLTISNMAGVNVQGYVPSTNQEIENFIGYKYSDPIGGNTGQMGTSNYHSFKSDSSTAKLQNDGPVELSGLNYPTSDGSANQVLKTDGSGNLGFTTISASFDGDLDGETLTDSSDNIITIKPNTSNNAAVSIEDSGNGSPRFAVTGSSSDLVGPSFEVKDQTGSRMPMSFIASNIFFEAGSATDELRFKTGFTNRMIVKQYRVDASVPVSPGSYASTGLPGSPAAGDMITVSDAASTTNGSNNYQPAYYDGTNWRFVNNNLIVT